MFRNYLKIAWRNLTKNKGYSIINIGGLAIGMTVAMLIGLWVWDELSFNQSFTNYNRIAQVIQKETVNGQIQVHDAVPIPLVQDLRTHYGSSFERIALTAWNGKSILGYGNQKIVKEGTSVEPQFPRMLDLRMQKGSVDGLKEPNTILLSESLAKVLFGQADPLNKLIRLNNALDVKVTGIYTDMAANTTFRDVAFLTPFSTYLTIPWVNQAQQNWTISAFQIFVQIAPQTTFEAVSTRIGEAIVTNLPAQQKATKPEVSLQPMSQWHLYANWKNGVQTGGRIQLVWLFGTIGLFVLVLACINFMNLSTARSQKRAKEVGIRKAIGSLQTQLIYQFFGESLLIVLIAFLLAIGLTQLFLPVFNQLAEKQLTIVWLNPWFWFTSLGFVLFTSLLAGSYPAFYLSSFQPVRVLKGTIQAGRLASIPRKTLVVVQFTVSISIVIGTLMVYRQVEFARNRPVGYSREGLLQIQMTNADIHDHFDVVRSELIKAGVINEMAESQSPTTAVWSSDGEFDWVGKHTTTQADFAVVGTSVGYGKTIGWQIKQGRDFSLDFPTDSTGLILNQKAVKFMGIQQPVGQLVRWGSKRFKIIGVVDDIIMSSPYEPVKGTVFFLEKGPQNFVDIKLSPHVSLTKALSVLASVFRKYNPSAPFAYQFVDQEYSKKFAMEEQAGNLSSALAGLAIFISCLGLFALASFTTEQRTKEIGVRKILGASILQVWSTLSVEFILLVSIAFLLASPVTYYFLKTWLVQYEYRAAIPVWIFVFSGIGALTITLLTVSFQSIKAALMNPVKSLRSE